MMKIVYTVILGAVFLTGVMVVGCSRKSSEKSAVDITVDYVTGKTPIEQGKKASSKIRGITESRKEDIEDLGF